MKTCEQLQTIAVSYQEILAGESPWIPLGMFIHDFFGNFTDRREELLRDPIVEPENPTPEQHEWAAFCAGAVEYLCAKYHLPCPEWVSDPRFTLKDPWFVSKLVRRNPRLQDQLRTEAPTPFARRNVFCDDRIFANKYEIAQDLEWRRLHSA